RITGLPFVFAAWIVRPGLSPADLAPYLQAFHTAASLGAGQATAMAQAAAKEWALPTAAIVSYLTEECQHAIDPDLQAQAIALFGKYAKAHGLATESNPPKAFHLAD
ncbi:MAG: putative solute-binding protein, partial [Gammaproteobacteria bacterium]